MLMWDRSGDFSECEPQVLCSFGITEAIVASVAGALTSIGVGGATAAAIAPALAGGLGGAGIGALGSAVTGGKPLIGALTGGITGGAISGFGGPVGDALGIGTTAGDALVGAGAGAFGSAITGGNPLTGAATGGASGLTSGLIGSLGSSAPSGTGVGGGAGSALSAAPDFTTAGAAPTDLTSGLSTAAGGTGFAGGGTASTGAIGAGTGFAGGAAGNGELAGLSAPTSGDLASTTGAFAGPTGAVPAGVELAPQDAAAVQSSAGAAAAGGASNSDLSLTNNLPSWLGGPDTAANPGGNPGGANGGLSEGGTYILPPPAPIAPGSTVVDPNTGDFLNPGDPNYTAAVNSLEATPNVAAPATPAPATGLNGIAQSLGLSSGGQLAGLGIGAAGLGYNLLTKNSIPGESNISNLSNQLQNQSAQLQSYVQNGTLPPGVATVLTQVQKSMTDQIKAKYAQLGMSGSTAETQDLDNAALQVQSQGATEALNLMNQGVSLTQLSGQLMTTLLQSNTQQANQTVQSISGLASALAGGGQKITLNAASA